MTENRCATNKKLIYLFVEVLNDETFRFGECLENRALKSSANKEVNQKKVFTARLIVEKFIERNKQHFFKYGYEMLVLDTKKLQTKFNTLKKKWREINDGAKKGSLSP